MRHSASFGSRFFSAGVYTTMYFWLRMMIVVTRSTMSRSFSWGGSEVASASSSASNDLVMPTSQMAFRISLLLRKLDYQSSSLTVVRERRPPPCGGGDRIG